MARPSKRGETTRAALLASLRLGSTRTAAAKAAGIHRDTLRLWLQEDAALLPLVEEAEADAVRAHSAAYAAQRALDGKGRRFWSPQPREAV